MASPQCGDGFTKIANEIMDALINYRIPGEQMVCLLYIIRMTYGFNKKEDAISNSQFVKATGIKKPNICRAISSLIKKNLVIKKDNRLVPIYCFNKNYDTWKSLSKKITVIKSDNSCYQKREQIKERKKVPKKERNFKDILKTYIHFFERYTDKELVKQTIETLKQTRKRKKIADAKIYSILERMDKHSIQKVEAGCKIYIEHAYHLEGKKEEYLLAIIKNQLEQTKDEDDGWY